MEKNQLQKEKELLEQRMSLSLQTFQASVNMCISTLYFLSCLYRVLLQEDCDRKMVELETNLTLANIEKQALLEQKELVVQQLMREKEILQVHKQICKIIEQALLKICLYFRKAWKRSGE